MSQVTDLTNWKQIKKTGLREIIQHKEIWNAVDQTIKNIFESKYDEKRLYEHDNKLWHEIANFEYDFRKLRELKTLFESGKLETIYTEYLANRSDYNGNHGQITMQYAYEFQGKYEITQIRLHCLGVKETKNGFVYLRHGGNYSFEHDVVSSLNYFLFGNSEGFKQRSL